MNVLTNINATNVTTGFSTSSTNEIDYSEAWKIFCSRLQQDKLLWIFTPKAKEEMGKNDYKILYEEKINDPRVFKGKFKLLNDQNQPPKHVDFLMTHNNISIAQIKNQIGKITDISADKIQISFKGLQPLKDEDNLMLLGCNGWGGEFFFVKFLKDT